MKLRLLLALLLSVGGLCATTLHVGFDATCPYASIQMAIDDSANGDTVLVHPGTYRENIDFHGHSVTLSSLYAVTADTTFIHTTRIIGESHTSAICSQSGESVIIDGFTIMNDEQEQYIYTNWSGGGILTYNNGYMVIRNNIITKCFAGNFGGGICIGSSTVTLSGNRIFECMTSGLGGGLAVDNGTQVIFDPIHLNSIYNNHSIYGIDLVIYNTQHNIDIDLDLVSRSFDAVDNYFIRTYESPNVTVNTRRSSLRTVNADLYVAPWGSDANVGTDPSQPLQTLEYAVRIIYPDSLRQNTIHLAPGTYSHSQNNQIFPLATNSYVNISGAGSEETIFNIEGEGRFGGCLRHMEKAVFTGFQITDSGGANLQNVFSIGGTNDVVVNGLSVNNSSLTSISITYSNNTFIDNVQANAINSGLSDLLLLIGQCKSIVLHNIIGTDLHADGEGGWNGGVFIRNSDVVAGNNAIMNSTAYANQFFYYGNFDTNPDFDPDAVLYMTNLLVANNHGGAGDFEDAVVTIGNETATNYINNCTIANNVGPYHAMTIVGDAVVSNLVLHNPGEQSELKVKNTLWGDNRVWMNNCLIRGGLDDVSCEDWTDFFPMNIIDGDPLFLGQTDNTLTRDMIDYYRLSANSPCIDAGIADTTGMHIARFDFAGNHRVWGDAIDIGCFEYGSEPNSVPDETQPPLPACANVSNFPNPINLNRHGGTIFSFNLPDARYPDLNIAIYNIRGQRVFTDKVPDSIAKMAEKAGVTGNRQTLAAMGRSYAWRATDQQGHKVPTGMYIVAIRQGDHVVAAGKFTVVK